MVVVVSSHSVCRSCPEYECQLLKYVNRGFSVVDLEMNRAQVEQHPFMLKEPGINARFSWRVEFMDDVDVGDEIKQGGGKVPGKCKI